MAAAGPEIGAKRTALRVFVASILASALLGIWALLAGDFGDLQAKVLFSSLSVSAASLLAMGGAARLEARPGWFPAAPAIVLAVLGLVLVLLGLWTEATDDTFWKTTATVCFFATAHAHASLLQLARLSRRHVWVGASTVALSFVLAVHGTWMMWNVPVGETAIRVLGVLSILVAAGTLATPVFDRLGRGEVEDADTSEGGVAMLCPNCGTRFVHALGEVECPRCATRFRVDLLDPA